MDASLGSPLRLWAQRVAAWLVAGGLCACAAPPASAPGTAPATAQAPAQAPTPIERRYLVDPAQSDIRFLVYRAGPLARLGHNHVIVATGYSGEIAIARDFHASRFQLDIPLAELIVDPSAARRDEGPDFAAEPDADAIAGTRANMLGPRVLNVAEFAHLRVRTLALAGPDWAPDVTVRIGLHGVERDLSVPVALDMNDARLRATAVFEIRQSDFGITPLAVLGGALQVADVVRVRLRIVALRLPDTGR